MIYYLLLKQTGEGCDYTIGCGMTFRQLISRTYEEALKEARARMDDHGGLDRFELAVILDVKKVMPLPLDDWRLEGLEAAEKAAMAEIEKAERETYERLRAKFGPPLPGTGD